MGTMSHIVTLNGAAVSHQPNGHLECLEHKRYYCDHIEQVINADYDVQALWDIFEDAPGPGYGAPVMVPIVPNYNLWMQVNLVTILKIKNTLEIQAVPPQYVVTERAGSVFPSPDPIFLGYLNPGEGRRILQETLDNWLFTLPNGTCENKHHSFSAQVRYTDLQKTPEGRRMCWWFYVLTRWCPWCIVADDDFDDLVPKDERRRP
jgi:hypothetical protein